MTRVPRRRTSTQVRDDVAFWQFHDDNPWVLTHLVRLSLEAVAKGFSRVGLDLLLNILRWETTTPVTVASDGFKINDRHRSRYARVIMHVRPELRGLFELRYGKNIGTSFDASRGGRMIPGMKL